MCYFDCLYCCTVCVSYFSVSAPPNAVNEGYYADVCVRAAVWKCCVIHRFILISCSINIKIEP